MTKRAVELTDPARELASLASSLIHVGITKQLRVLPALAKGIGVDDNAPELLDLLACVGRRLRSLEGLANSLGEDELDKDQRQELVQAIGSFGQLVHPRNASQDWDHLRHQLLPDKSVTAFRWFSSNAKKFRPLRVIADSDREEALQRLEEVLKEVRTDPNISDWMQAPLVEGLEQAALALKYLHCFGHEAAIAELLLLHQRVEHFIQRNETDAQSGRSSPTITSVLNAVCLAANIFILPHEVAGALERYGSWTQSAVRAIASSKGDYPQRLLPPPRAILPSEVAVGKKRDEDDCDKVAAS
uniref:Uncharacterized protein n=1 Tax=Rhodopseudomonas palustris (strain BisA53) TaxID=316055 RepID=Q07VM2_RHOP5